MLSDYMTKFHIQIYFFYKLNFLKVTGIEERRKLFFSLFIP